MRKAQRRQDRSIRDEIAEGLDAYGLDAEVYRKQQRIERCGTVTSWPGRLPASVSETNVFVRLPDGEYRSVFIQ